MSISYQQNDAEHKMRHCAPLLKISQEPTEQPVQYASDAVQVVPYHGHSPAGHGPDGGGGGGGPGSGGGGGGGGGGPGGATDDTVKDS